MLQFICARFSFSGLFYVIVYLWVCFRCVRFLYYAKRLARKNISKIGPILCRMGRKTLLQSQSVLLVKPDRSSVYDSSVYVLHIAVHYVTAS